MESKNTSYRGGGHGGRKPISNLHCFLQQTTPMVPTHLLSKSCLRGLSTPPQQPHRQYYFSLSDLWDGFDEWSVYGAGIPILVNGIEAFTQYYVPYLSAIQLYSSSSTELSQNRRFGDMDSEGSEMDFRNGFTSEVSTESEGERMQYCGGYVGVVSGLEEPWSPTTSADSRDEYCTSESLLFQYFESKIPTFRVPLYENIKGLSKEFPALQKLCSNNLSNSSWMSVAWYPIYRIPSGVTLEHFSTSFLTYHSLSTSLTDDRGSEMHAKAAHSVRYLPAGDQVMLEPFGLASYKFKHSIWTTSTWKEADCCNLLVKQLQEGADNWVKQLNVSHPDLKYFNARGARR